MELDQGISISTPAASKVLLVSKNEDLKGVELSRIYLGGLNFLGDKEFTTSDMALSRDFVRVLVLGLKGDSCKL